MWELYNIHFVDNKQTDNEHQNIQPNTIDVLSLFDALNSIHSHRILYLHTSIVYHLFLSFSVAAAAAPEKVK